MRYDITPTNRKYRGMERTLTTSELLEVRTKKFEDLLDEYFDYVEICEEVSETTFEKILVYYEKIRKYGIDCEVIGYDKFPLENVYGYPVELLGIDITDIDMAESLISDEINPCIRHLLNESGLCKTEEDVKIIIPFQDCGDMAWYPCYVYKVNIPLVHS